MNQVNTKPASTFTGKILIFKIYCCSSNSPPGQLELSASSGGKSDWTYYPSEKEVNLLPFFTFQVADVTETDMMEVKFAGTSVQAQVMTITVVEVPF